ncbi:MAG TPA: PilZ domain-containing protein [Polyangia bacterium]|nr:PilZ domain-containing protein [Polyangia bacterium]
MDERRRTKRDRRRARRIAATFAVKNSTGGHVQLCQAEDICPGGMTIKRPKDLSYTPRTTVALAFALPGMAELIAAEGLITSDAASGSFRRTGISFIALRPEHQRLIAGFCRRSQRA